jgi:hypothetical protein
MAAAEASGASGRSRAHGPLPHHEHAGRLPRHGGRLAKDQLDRAGVLVHLTRELDRARGRLDPGELDEAALGARKELRRDDEHVPAGQGDARGRERARHHGGHVVAAFDERHAGHGERLETMAAGDHATGRTWRCRRCGSGL